MITLQKDTINQQNAKRGYQSTSESSIKEGGGLNAVFDYLTKKLKVKNVTKQNQLKVNFVG